MSDRAAVSSTYLPAHSWRMTDIPTTQWESKFVSILCGKSGSFYGCRRDPVLRDEEARFLATQLDGEQPKCLCLSVRPLVRSRSFC